MAATLKHFFVFIAIFCICENKDLHVHLKSENNNQLVIFKSQMNVFIVAFMNDKCY